MSAVNRKPVVPMTVTHEGAPTKKVNDAEELLRRTVMACMLWEDQFYEDGKSIADRIAEYIPNISAERVAEIALEAREQMKLRHAPLLIARVMAKLPTHRHIVARTLEKIIQRPDELNEFVSIYWKNKKEPLSAQVKKGLAAALKKFNEFTLAKFNQDKAVKLRDVLFLSHAKPDNKEQEKLFKKLAENKLATPDTWETAISKTKDKKAEWTRLLTENKLGAMALIRNLRNMLGAGVSKETIRKGLSEMKTDRVLPYRFIASARYAPDFEPELESAMYKCIADKEKIKGKTILLIDVSGSMDAPISDKSEMQRLDAACGLGILARELCEEVEIMTFSTQLVKIPPRRGFALRDAITGSQPHGGTDLGGAVATINRERTYDRLIVITDEQSHTRVNKPNSKGYIINVASYENGIGYGDFIHINGWSEAVLDYIRMYEEPVKPRPVSTSEVKYSDAVAFGKLGSTRSRKNAKSGAKKTGSNTGKRVQRSRAVRKGK